MNGKKMGWDDYAIHTNSIWPSEQLIRHFNLINKKRKIQSVLEIGCGAGRNSIFLAKNCENLTVIDISEFAVEKTLRKLNDNGLTATALVGPIEDQEMDSYDLIVDISTLQHCNPQQLPNIILKLHQATNQDGYIFSIMKTPNDSIKGYGNKIDDQYYYFPSGVEKVYFEANISFLERNDILDIYSIFNEVEINKEEWTYDFGKNINSHWLINAKK